MINQYSKNWLAKCSWSSELRVRSVRTRWKVSGWTCLSVGTRPSNSSHYKSAQCGTNVSWLLPKLLLRSFRFHQFPFLRSSRRGWRTAKPILNYQCLQLWCSFRVTSYNDCVELTLFEIRIRHGNNRLILTFLSHLQRRLQWIDIHVARLFFEIYAREKFLVSFIVHNVNLARVGRRMYHANLRLVGRRSSYVVIDDVECGFVIGVRHDYDGVVLAATQPFAILGNWLRGVLT